ncbi:MAG: DUF4160 domain-containing protein [Gemmatimonadetes bacterium]|nr:DUF4160 domain-containing protein [Gemmatimonadota bacterium]
MPSIGGIPGPYRFSFYSFDCNEPPHVHVQRERAKCKFWLLPVALATNYRLAERELGRIRQIILEHHGKIIGAWNEHCGR